MNDDLKETLELIELRKKFGSKEDMCYRIGRRCSDVANTIAFLPVGWIISKSVFPLADKPDKALMMENIALYSAWIAFFMLLVSTVFCCFMIYYWRKSDKIDKKFNFFA